eukprot:1572320-Pleurochrysis_carterae.AAC.2
MVVSGVGDGRGNRRVRRTRCQPPGKRILVEVDLGGEDHTRYAWNVHVVSPGFARFHSESSATERQDGHNAGLDTGQAFIGGDRTAWWPSSAVQHVHGMSHGVGPKRRGSSACNQIGTSQFHDTGADCPLGDAVQLMYVWRTCCGMYPFIGEQFGELFREKFSRFLAVKCADDSRWCVAAFIQQSGEASQEMTYVFGRLMFVTHHVHGLEAGVVVDDNESVASAPVHRRSPECGRRVALASAQAEHEGAEAWRRLCGVSDVRSESCLRRALPQCRRRCM